jgi:hypothetical protein
MPRLHVLDRDKDDEVLCPLLDVVNLQVEPPVSQFNSISWRAFPTLDVPAKVLRNGD